MKVKSDMKVYWTLLLYEGWSIYLAATTKGLCYVGSQNKPFEEFNQWVEKHFAKSALIEDEERLQPYVNEFKEYLRGDRKHFTLPFDFRGTPFQMEVWNALCQIPYGQTKSYSDIAASIQKPKAVRAIGSAIGANPILITVPCHRVIGKNGTLTGYRGGLEMKKQLLQLEGN
ncbi:methylated-DNA--[protein]-cysteine S-methyltransferase [Ammoniphilus sp. CFH 90114]|uniref:methylated-DNA--[protein]-cysteine S-methyltransferase n=1 Tax=Ammoniphilus sp. CFH 90114 TaxID=2493665 RepID=UPI00100F9B95|nr:methylated-DNA--[protein]-cysteine S-methyltransferase [Ammoniphilus sp. CFH 90114]RXT02809.1 methylated-DNA--[protein]-cysteine S-methyltransferase [Ammoniphilus sp. CFH 90114]